MTIPFENFSDAGKELLKTAQEQARSFGHNYIGTEHLLLAELDAEESQGHGPLRDRQVNKADVAAHLLAKLGTMTTEADALRSIGIDPVALVERARNNLGVDLEIGGLAPITRRLPQGVDPSTIPRDALAVTPRLFKVLNMAVGIALLEPVQPRHILLALLEEDGGLAVVVLDNLGVDLEGLRAELSGVA
jgi:ATP-dependent Clp protease ATP-binding subunit ClpA